MGRLVRFFLRGVAQVSVQAAETAGHILILRETHRNFDCRESRLFRRKASSHPITSAMTRTDRPAM
jgi:hypothetical protein